MLQIYFISIVVIFLGGLALVAEYLGEKRPSLASLKDYFGRKGVTVTLGFLSLIAGILKFFIRAPFDTVPVAGDLLPALVGIALGLALLMGFFKSKVSEPSELMDKAEKMALTYRVPLGFLGIAVAIVHFLFPGAVLL